MEMNGGPSEEKSHDTECLRIDIQGVIQGMGFRPFIYRLAQDLKLHGWVLNSSEGVTVEVEGPTEQVRKFVPRIYNERPQHCVLQTLQFDHPEPRGYDSFEIRESDSSEKKKHSSCLI